MKKIICGACVFMLQICTVFSSYAGQWQQDKLGWKYENDSREQLTNSWVQDTDGRWYYFGPDSYMNKNTMTPDGCVVGENGAWIDGLGKNNDQAISPWFYQSLLGKGMNVTWSEFRKQANTYNVQMVKDFKRAGVSHVRIRVKDEISTELLDALDQQITDCLTNGIIPVLAYQAHEFKENPTQQNMDEVTLWWRAMAEHFRDYSHLLSFDLMIESSDAVNKLPESLNQLYEQTVSAIRKSSPDRIIMISPRLRSDPNYLHELKIPSAHNGYLMAEWHFYASGPDKSNEKKKWTTGTEDEKKLITDKINTALEWQAQTGVPTWVGAWMPGNYNKGDTYSSEEQTVFASYMTAVLTNAGIPFAVNADTKYYNATDNTWMSSMQPVIKAIWEQNF